MSTLRSLVNIRPFGGFNMIMADPPWQFELHSALGEEKAPQAHYQCESTQDICDMPVEAIAADDCLLWLWATNPMLPDAFKVLDAWGFEFKTAGTWAKRTVHGKDAFGTGYVLRSSNEPFLIGTRGKPKTTKSTRSTVATYDDGAHASDLPYSSITIEAVAREHSRKPDEAFTAAENLMPEARRVELFSRQVRKGWSVWGNETGKFDAV